MKKRFLFVLALLSVLSLTGCKDDDKKITALSAPQQINIQSDGDKSLIIFDEVKGAEYYDIYINDVCVTVKASGTGSIQFDASKIITLPQKYTIKVKAGSDKYFDSQFTEDYEYNHTRALTPPSVEIDETTLNWVQVENAEFYDVLVTTKNPTNETIYRTTTNKFDFSNILSNKGEYLFKVRAISESGDYLDSVYSNQVTYVHKITLITPYNLSVDYDDINNEMMLSFMSSEEVDNFTININGSGYTFGEVEKSKFLLTDLKKDFSNLYVIKFTSFAKYKGVDTTSSNALTIKVKANTNNTYNTYLISSQFSNSVSCQFLSTLSVPTFNLKTNENTCTICDIATASSPYLSGFAIYLNDKKFKTIGTQVKTIELPLIDVENVGIRLQAISNNVNCYSSNLSEVKYADKTLTALNALEIICENNVVSWGNVENATDYYVEVFNSVFRWAEVTHLTSISFEELCDYGKYNVRVIAMADNFKQSESTIEANHIKTLDTPKNPQIVSVGDITYLQFEEVGAYGYALDIEDLTTHETITIKTIFKGSPIELNKYITKANGYNIQVKAVNFVNSGIKGSALTEKKRVDSVKTLSTPIISIFDKNGEYYLKIDVNENEIAEAKNYEIWINYKSIGSEYEFKDMELPITEYLENAGHYDFMVQVKAYENNNYVNDSIPATKTYTRTMQLPMVKNIEVTPQANESRYTLTFEKQPLASEYRVMILKGEDENYKKEFYVTASVVDITPYVIDNGVYRVYVQAIAKKGENEVYTDSLESGNPARFVKGQTLLSPENILIAKDSENPKQINISWDSVENAIGYEVKIYYNYKNTPILVKSVKLTSTENPTLNIGSDKYLSINQEGSYNITIRALGDDDVYETSQASASSYNYVMETLEDFKRASVFMYGQTLDYQVETLDDLKHLLWYHYLYNEDVWNYNTLEYNLKIYCDKNLDELAPDDIKEEVATKTYNKDKMDIIARYLLKQYPEFNSMTLGLRESSGEISDFCVNISTNENIYILGYKSNFVTNKKQTLATSTKVFGDKMNTIKEENIDKRPTNYEFVIDHQESVNVSTTEQLFMALQYNKKPNFVGDCQVAKTVYNNARFVLREICVDTMSEYEKTLRIYEFLTKRITLNSVGGNVEDNINLVESIIKRGELRDFYLEGIFYNYSSADGVFTNINQFIGQTADSEGLAKAFVVLCSLEGINSIKVNWVDENTGNNRACNKVYIDANPNDTDITKSWYVIDLANAMKNTIDVEVNEVVTTYQVSTHAHFLISDEDAGIDDIETMLHKPLGDISYATTNIYNYYQTDSFEFEHKGELIEGNYQLDSLATATNEIVDLMMYAMTKTNNENKIVIDFYAKNYIDDKTNGVINDETLRTVINSMNSAYTTAVTNMGRQYSLQISVVDAKYIVFAVSPINV